MCMCTRKRECEVNNSCRAGLPPMYKYTVDRMPIGCLFCVVPINAIHWVYSLDKTTEFVLVWDFPQKTPKPETQCTVNVC